MGKSANSSSEKKRTCFRPSWLRVSHVISAPIRLPMRAQLGTSDELFGVEMEVSLVNGEAPLILFDNSANKMPHCGALCEDRCAATITRTSYNA